MPADAEWAGHAASEPDIRPQLPARSGLTRRRIAGLSLLAALAGPAEGAAQGSTEGRVLGDDGRPVAGARIAVADTPHVADTDERAAPVDVIPAGRIAESGQVELAAALNELAPSVYFPRRSGADLTSGVRPFQLRGLSPDHALVLVNGKRRHATAVVHTSGGGAFPGSSGVDLNAVPAQAIRRMEIVRDADAARYGSGAIAGVVDLRLRNTVSAPEFIASLGRHFPDEWGGDGTRYDLSANWGVALGRRGVLNLTGAFSQREPTNRAGPDPRDQIVPGDADFVDRGTVVRKNHEVAQPNQAWGDGESSNRMLFANLELPLGDPPQAARVYAFGGYSLRRERHADRYVRALDDRNWHAIHPLGFLPTFDTGLQDLSGVAGVRGGAESGWRWDVSAEYGANRVNIDLFNTLNPSLGPCVETSCAPGADGIRDTGDDPDIPNRTRFRAGALDNARFLVAADVRRRLDLGLSGGEATLALGVSLGRERYEVVAGEPGSYGNGFHPSQSGGVAASGAQGFAGFRPAEAGRWGRSNLGVHWEAAAPLRRNVLASAAGRYERYGDVGGALGGTLAVRVDVADGVTFRTGASTGFRAPALSQSHYGHVAAGVRADPDHPGRATGFEVGTFPLAAPAARAVGAIPLTLEKARSLRAGFALVPMDDLRASVDAYATEVDDAIILSNPLARERVEPLLADFDAESVRFFLNAVDLRAYGLDAAASWRTGIGNAAWFELGAVAHWSRVRGRCPDGDISACVAENPILRDRTPETYDAFDVYALEEGPPDWRGALTAAWTRGTLRVGLGANVYGSQEELRQLGPGGVPAVVRRFDPEVTLDAHVTWTLGDRWRLTLGGENLLDAFPSRVDAFGGVLPYRSTAATGFNGRYLYTRVRVSGL